MKPGQLFIFEGEEYIFSHWISAGRACVMHSRTREINWLTGVHLSGLPNAHLDDTTRLARKISRTRFSKRSVVTEAQLEAARSVQRTRRSKRSVVTEAQLEAARSVQRNGEGKSERIAAQKKSEIEEERIRIRLQKKAAKDKEQERLRTERDELMRTEPAMRQLQIEALTGTLDLKFLKDYSKRRKKGDRRVKARKNDI